MQEIKPNHVARYQWALDEIRKRCGRGATVLDAACGVGYGSHMLAKEGYIVHAIDRSLEALQWHLQYFRHARIRVSMGDIHDVPLDHYDAIVSIETIEHVPDAQKWIERLKAPLIIGTVPNEDVVPFASANNEYHFRHYTKDQFDELMPGHKTWFTQYGAFEECEMRPGSDGMTLGVVCEL